MVEFLQIFKQRLRDFLLRQQGNHVAINQSAIEAYALKQFEHWKKNFGSCHDLEEPLIIKVAGFDQGYQNYGRGLDLEGVVTISR